MTKKCTDCGVVVDSLKGTYNMWLLRNRDAEGNPIEVAEQSEGVDINNTDEAKDLLTNIGSGTDSNVTPEQSERFIEVLKSPNQIEIDTLTAQLETVTDKKERTKIKNRIQYLKRP